MKNILVIALALLICGCANMTPAEQKQTALIVGGLIIVGVIAAQSSSDTPAKLNCFWAISPDGHSTQVCR